jgi:amino acid transporter
MTVRQDDRGRVTHLLFALGGYDRVPWYETPAFTGLLLGACVLLLLSVLVAAPIWLIIRRARGGERPPRPARAARWLQVALVVLLVLFVVGLSHFRDQAAAFQGKIPGRRLTLSIPILMIALTIGSIVFTVLAWKRRYWRVAGRIHYTLLTVGAVALCWFFYNWNQLGWWY